MNSTSDLAKATISQLDLKPQSPERAKHKFNMIRIAERMAAGIPIDDVAANNEIVAACEWCDRQAA